MIFEWLRGRPRNPPRPTVPAGSRIYAIGDIHGRDDLLAALLEQIKHHSENHSGRRVLICLGDYVDRGLHSQRVIDALDQLNMPDFETIFLKGNHDVWLLQALDEITQIHPWIETGGLATLLSYGVAIPSAGTPEQRAQAIQQGLRAALPQRHRCFLSALRPYHLEGDYLFVHAGIRPGVALAEQREQDLFWIRDEFLNDNRDYGYCVVHGHSMEAEPQRQANRIGVDTGAYATGRLSCLVLEGETQQFLHT